MCSLLVSVVFEDVGVVSFVWLFVLVVVMVAAFGDVGDLVLIFFLSMLMIIKMIIMIINLIYIAQFDTNCILTALYMVINYIQTQYNTHMDIQETYSDT